MNRINCIELPNQENSHVNGNVHENMDEKNGKFFVKKRYFKHSLGRRRLKTDFNSVDNIPKLADCDPVWVRINGRLVKNDDKLEEYGYNALNEKAKSTSKCSNKVYKRFVEKEYKKLYDYIDQLDEEVSPNGDTAFMKKNQNEGNRRCSVMNKKQEEDSVVECIQKAFSDKNRYKAEILDYAYWHHKK